MYKSVMGAHRSLGCATVGNYYDEVEEGESYECFELEFFSHWDQILMYIDDYLYSGMNYEGDLDLPLLPRRAWGPNGK